MDNRDIEDVLNMDITSLLESCELYQGYTVPERTVPSSTPDNTLDLDIDKYLNLPLETRSKSCTPPLEEGANGDSIVDDNLLEEIDQLINASAISHGIPTSEIGPPKESSSCFNGTGGGNAATNGTVPGTVDMYPQRSITKKPSYKRLSTTPQSPSSMKRIARSPTQQSNTQFGMAHAAAMLATNNSPSKNCSNMVYHENAKAAAAQAIGSAQHREPITFKTSVKRNANYQNAKLKNASIQSSNASVYSTHSKISNVSNNSSTFDSFYSPSTDTLETIISFDQPRRFTSDNIESRHSTRTSSTSSSHELVALTPSPVVSPRYQQITFTPPNTIGKSPHSEPLTPISKTTMKFSQLSTKSPEKKTFPSLESVANAANTTPQLSVWKTRPQHPKTQHVNHSKQKLSPSHSSKRPPHRNTLKLNTFVDRQQSEHQYPFPTPYHQTSSLSPPLQVPPPPPPLPSSSKSSSFSPKQYTQSNAGYNLLDFSNSPITIVSNYTTKNYRNSVTSTTSSNSTISNTSTHTNNAPKQPNIAPSKSIIGPSFKYTNSYAYAKEKSSTNSHKHVKSETRPLNTGPVKCDFRSLVNTFNKKEKRKQHPKVYSNMNQGMSEFQVNIGK